MSSIIILLSFFLSFYFIYVSRLFEWMQRTFALLEPREYQYQEGFELLKKIEQDLETLGSR